MGSSLRLPRRRPLRVGLACLVVGIACTIGSGPRPLAPLSCLSVAVAEARPGGGGSFHGSSRGSSFHSSGSSFSSHSTSGGVGRSFSSHGAGSGGDDGLVLSLLVWVLSSPAGLVTVSLLAVFLAAAWIVASRRDAALTWQAGVDEHRRRLSRVRSELEALRASDPNFSVVLLEDFLYALYAQAQTLRGGDRLGHLSAFVSEGATRALASLGPVAEVRAVIVGAMRFLSASETRGPGARVGVEVEFESNYTEVNPGGLSQSYYVRERWRLGRDRSVLSRTPDRVRVFVCPSCGAPLDGMDGGVCRYCQTAVNTGRFDWVVESIAIEERETRGPILTSNEPEEGTRLPTVFDPRVQEGFASLTQRDPAFGWPAFQARIGLIFERMQTAWSNRDWPVARPFVSDNLFQMLAYWIEAYRSAGLRNVTEQARVEQLELVRVTSDRFFDALTVRLYATSTDFTVADAGGGVVAGKPSRLRRYTEYWTLIRGANTLGPARSDGACPSCGAPLQIEMAGTCRYCRARVTSGEFDWVLSRIEQDEVYEG